MRIIAGEFKSRILLAPKGNDTRPTLDMTRESLFNIIFKKCANSEIVLDLFAGSGALAFEAISRGAKTAIIVDKARNAIECIKINSNSLNLNDRIKIIKASWEVALNDIKTSKFDIIFIDPPYRYSYDSILEKIYSLDLLAKDGIIVVEHEKGTNIIENDIYTIYDKRAYKNTEITFIRKVCDENGTISR